MEICQTGYYTEDFRTQEVPAGFDFASYGEFYRITWLMFAPSHEAARKAKKKKRLSWWWYKLLSLSDELFIFFIYIYFFLCLHNLFPLNLSNWRTEEIFSQSVSSHLSELSQWDLDTRGALTQGLCQDYGVQLCVCVCVCVCACDYAWMGWGRQRQRETVWSG